MRIRTCLRALATALPCAGFAVAAHASVFGTLGNFDVVNDTGSVAHGFEIELEDLHLGDISDTFGGVGRGFPSGRGFDPQLAVQRYGAPTVTEYDAGGGIFGVRVT
ncbi:MAG: PEP-CTERM sorting domain-containing protein, partial [Rhodoferax sp.]|nr:PEP-CTERM sorting domain-containing protein [Rhodoferax sp.]